MITEFAGIHNHSHFSFLDGISTPEEMVLAAKEKGLRSIALTDHGHCHGISDLYIMGKKHGVRTLYGVEAYVIHSLKEWSELRDKIAIDRKAAKKAELDEQSIDLEKTADAQNRRLLRRKGHLVLVAANQEGLANIYQIVHKAHKYGYYMKPRADKDILRQHSRGVLASSACMGGVISNWVWMVQRGEATVDDLVREALEYDEIFGRGRFFLELQFNEHEGQSVINRHLVMIHQRTGIPLIATADAHYVLPDDWETQEILHMLMTHRGQAGGVTMGNRPPTYSFKTRSLFIKSPQEMWESYERWGREDVPQELALEAFRNTMLFDSLVEDFEPNTSQRLPTLEYDSPLVELGARALAGLKARNLHEDHRYVERLLYEVKMIKEKGISSYFLVVDEIVKAARKEMLIGPGRGSAGGSLICYLLGITNIDPIEHNLMFERFINVDRVEVPDIDLDFQDVDRVKQLLRDKFGEDNVACISTFGTNQIKGIVKDVCRVFDIEHTEANRANAKIEKELQVLYQQGEAKSAVIIKLEDVYRLSPTFNSFIKEHPQIEKPIQRLYQRAHHVGRHASGVVIGDNLPAETAVFTSKGILQTSFTDGVVNKNLSAMGLVKFDILGLATLDVIDRACKLIAERSGRSVEEVMSDIDPKSMDFNDLNIMKTVFWEGNTTGIFQFTGGGISKLGKAIRPDCFDDVAAIGALYRPGPLGSHMDKLYAVNKQKSKDGTLTYDHPILEEILKDTYGCFVYQEHILEMGRRLGKLSWKDTNRLRKLFLKRTKDAAAKRDDEAEELKGKLIAGFMENGLSQEYGEKTWKELEAWASYGFNRAHAKAYGMLTMQTAYLRTYHPLEFFAAVLSCGQASELQFYVDAIRRQGFKILPVDVNVSGTSHAIEGDGIRLALASVKDVGAQGVVKILRHRPYSSFIDFLDRSGSNKTVTTALIRAGAFEELEPNTGLLLKRHELFHSDHKFKTKKGRPEFERQYAELTCAPLDASELMAMEQEQLGFNLRYSAFSIKGRSGKLQQLFEDGVITDYQTFADPEDSTDECAAIPVVVKDIRERPQRNQKMMAFLKFLDANGQEFEAPCFGNIWGHVRRHVRKGEAYIVIVSKKPEEPERIVVGRPGWAQSEKAALSTFIRLDDA